MKPSEIKCNLPSGRDCDAKKLKNWSNSDAARKQFTICDNHMKAKK